MTTANEYTSIPVPTFHELAQRILDRFEARMSDWSAYSDSTALRRYYEFANGTRAEMRLVLDPRRHYVMNGDTHAANYFQMGIRFGDEWLTSDIREPSPAGFERTIERLIELPAPTSAKEAKYLLRKLRTRIGYDPNAPRATDADGEIIDPLDERLREILDAHGSSLCKECGRDLDRGDVAWNSASTEYGTPYSVIEIICQACDTEALHLESWYPGIDDFEEALRVLEKDWE